MAKDRVPGSSITDDTRITLYPNSPEISVLNPKHVRVVAPTISGGSYSPSLDMDSESFDWTAIYGQDPAMSIDTYSTIPSLGDIFVVSNVVRYDSTNSPYATITFKIKNSSGVAIKGMNVRVSK